VVFFGKKVLSVEGVLRERVVRVVGRLALALALALHLLLLLLLLRIADDGCCRELLTAIVGCPVHGIWVGGRTRRHLGRWL